MRLLACLAIAVVVMGRAVLAQAPTNAPPEAADDEKWSFTVFTYTYFVPDDRDYLQPTFTADRG